MLSPVLQPHKLIACHISTVEGVFPSQSRKPWEAH